MSIKPLTAEERARALEKAAEARRLRKDLKRRISEGEITPSEALADPAAQRMRVSEFLRAWRGVGTATADRIMEDVSIAPIRRVSGLTERQRTGILDHLKR